MLQNIGQLLKKFSIAQKIINKLRWDPQQPQPFIFTNLSEACREAKCWKHLSWVSVSQIAANPVEPDLALHQSLPDVRNLLRNPVEPDLSLPQTFSGTFSGTLLNLTWLCTKASQTFSGTVFGTLLILTGSAPKTRCIPRTRMLARMLMVHSCRNTWICSHAEHFSAIVYLNSLLDISPVTSPQCGGKVWSVECGV